MKHDYLDHHTFGGLLAALVVAFALPAMSASLDLKHDPATGQPGKFAAGYCITWHRVGGEGGHSGPDLGSLGNRFAIRDILVAICEPSASVSDQYLASVVKLKDGDTRNGRLIFRNDKEVGVATNPFDLNQVTKAPADQVAGVALSQVSMMPAESLSGMNRDELMDLMAYLLSGESSGHKTFNK